MAINTLSCIVWIKVNTWVKGRTVKMARKGPKGEQAVGRLDLVLPEKAPDRLVRLMNLNNASILLKASKLV